MMIFTHLGKADEQRPDLNGRVRRTVKLYEIERVRAAEVGAAGSDSEKWSEATARVRRGLQINKKQALRLITPC